MDGSVSAPRTALGDPEGSADAVVATDGSAVAADEVCGLAEAGAGRDVPCVVRGVAGADGADKEAEG